MPTELPAAGFAGPVPDLDPYLPDATERHRALWAELWSTPQAHAWSSERWRWPVIADLVRRMVQAEEPERHPVGVATAVRQLRDDLGLSTAGLKQHGWSIKAQTAPAVPTESPSQRLPRRLRAVVDTEGAS